MTSILFILAIVAGFAGSGAELVSLLARVEDLGAEKHE